MDSRPKNSTPEEREKRLSEIRNYLELFKSELAEREHVNIFYKDNSPEVINAIYYRYADEVIRPSIDSGTIQNFKIAAMMELVVLIVSPVTLVNIEQSKFYNARLALYVALRFIVEWNLDELDTDRCYEVLRTDKDFILFLDEHFKWLYMLDPNYYNPVFFNAQIWRLFFYLLKEKMLNRQ